MPPCKAKHKPLVGKTTVSNEAKAITIGEQGITLIEYIGWFEEDEYIGPVTRMPYRFGLDRPRGYVDNRDLDYILTITEDGQKVFRLWQS